MKAAVSDIAKQLGIRKSDLVRYSVTYCLEQIPDPTLLKKYVDSFNNGSKKHDGERESAREKESVEKATKLREIMMGP
jgi:hypothetical protein